MSDPEDDDPTDPMSDGALLGAGEEEDARLLRGARRAFLHGAALQEDVELDITAVHAAAPSERYELRELLGRGGMGEVYRAHDRHLGREVALKVVRAERRSSRALQRFREEARATARLQHPGIVPVYELGQLDDGPLYFTMKLIAGRTLSERLRAGRQGAEPALPVRRVVQILLEVARAVGYAHEGGVLHRDLKPQNIMLGRFGEVQVLDWGLVRALEATSEGLLEPSGTQTRDGTVLGTPGFMAPEQARGERAAVDARSDVFGLCATLYYALCAERPQPDDAALPALPLRRHDARLPRALEEICARGLALDPERRYPDTAALAADLQAFLEDRPLPSRPETAPERLARWGRRHGARLVAVAGALGLVSLVLVAALWSVDAAREAEAEERRRATSARADAEQVSVELRMALGEAEESRQTAYAVLANFMTQLQGMFNRRRSLDAEDRRLLRAVSAGCQRMLDAERRRAEPRLIGAQVQLILGGCVGILDLDAERALLHLDSAQVMLERGRFAREDFRALARSLTAQCQLLGAQFLHELDRGSEASARVDRALGELEPLQSRGSRDDLRNLALALALRAQLDGPSPEALQRQRRAVAIAAEGLPDEGLLRIDLVTDLGAGLAEVGALEAARAELAAARRLLARELPRQRWSRLALAELDIARLDTELLARARPEEARRPLIELLQRAEGFLRHDPEPAVRQVLEQCVRQLAALAERLGDRAQAAADRRLLWQVLSVHQAGDFRDARAEELCSGLADHLAAELPKEERAALTALARRETSRWLEHRPASARARFYWLGALAEALRASTGDAFLALLSAELPRLADLEQPADAEVGEPLARRWSRLAFELFAGNFLGAARRFQDRAEAALQRLPASSPAARFEVHRTRAFLHLQLEAPEPLAASLDSLRVVASAGPPYAAFELVVLTLHRHLLTADTAAVARLRPELARGFAALPAAYAEAYAPLLHEVEALCARSLGDDPHSPLLRAAELAPQARAGLLRSAARDRDWRLRRAIRDGAPVDGPRAALEAFRLAVDLRDFARAAAWLPRLPPAELALEDHAAAARAALTAGADVERRVRAYVAALEAALDGCDAGERPQLERSARATLARLVEHFPAAAPMLETACAEVGLSALYRVATLGLPPGG